MKNIIIVTSLLLVGCGNKIEKAQKRDVIWGKAEMIDIKCYKSGTDPRYIQTFKMDGYKFVIYTNGRGSAMVTIPSITIPSINDVGYIKLLEDENQLLGSMLAEYELDHD